MLGIPTKAMPFILLGAVVLYVVQTQFGRLLPSVTKPVTPAKP
jgi:hypothetical protein